MLEKRVSLITTLMACAISLLGATGGCLAWATSFQTKTAAAEQSQRLEVNERATAHVADQVGALSDELARVEATANRLEDKLDRALERRR